MSYIPKTDILHQRRIYVTPLLDLLQQCVDHVLEAGVLEATLLGLGQGRSDGQGDDDIVGILGGSAERWDQHNLFFHISSGAVHQHRETNNKPPFKLCRSDSNG